MIQYCAKSVVTNIKYFERTVPLELELIKFSVSKLTGGVVNMNK